MVFTKEEYNSRLTAIKQQMSKKALDVLIIIAKLSNYLNKKEKNPLILSM